jgi:hypothetical protein
MQHQVQKNYVLFCVHVAKSFMSFTFNFLTFLWILMFYILVFMQVHKLQTVEMGLKIYMLFKYKWSFDAKYIWFTF